MYEETHELAPDIPLDRERKIEPPDKTTTATVLPPSMVQRGPPNTLMRALVLPPKKTVSLQKKTTTEPTQVRELLEYIHCQDIIGSTHTKMCKLLSW